MTKLSKNSVITLGLAVLLSIGLMLTGCTQKEEPKKEQPKSGAGKASVKKEPEKPKGPKKADITPAAMEALQLMPESAAVAIAIPPLNGLIRKSEALALRVAPPEADVAGNIARALEDLARQLAVPGEPKTFGEIAAAKGIDFDAPMALFVDAAASTARLQKATEAMKAAAASASPAAGGEAAAPETAPQAVATFDSAAQAEKLFQSLWPPSAVGVLGCKDAAIAESSLKEFLASPGSPFIGTTPQTIDADGIAIQCYDPEKFAYFFSGKWLVVGTSVDFLKSVIPQLKKPAEFRYGTVECPPASADECVEILYMNKLAPFAKTVLDAWSACEPQAAALAKNYTAVLDAYQGSDPAVCTLAMRDDKIEFLSRLDMKAYPALKAYTGEASPLRLATLLPESSLLFLSMRLTPEVKAQMQQNIAGAMPGMVIPPMVAGMAPMVMQMLGDEVTIGLAGVQGIMPNVVLLAGLSNPDDTKQKLSAFMQNSTTPPENYNGVELKTVLIPGAMPIPVTVAFAQDVLLAGTDAATLKTIIDLLASKGTSPLFGSFNPPIDAAVPRFSALAIKLDALGAVVKQLVPLMGGEAPVQQITAGIDRATGAVRDVRMSQEMVDGWQRGLVTISLNPGGAI